MPNSILISESTIEKMKACQKLAIENPDTKYAANKTSPAFIISEKSPKVMKVNGSAISEIIGRMKRFINASTAANTNIGTMVVCTPGTIYAATPTKSAATIQWKNIRTIVISIHKRYLMVKYDYMKHDSIPTRHHRA